MFLILISYDTRLALVTGARRSMTSCGDTGSSLTSRERPASSESVCVEESEPIEETDSDRLGRRARFSTRSLFSPRTASLLETVENESTLLGLALVARALIPWAASVKFLADSGAENIANARRSTICNPGGSGGGVGGRCKGTATLKSASESVSTDSEKTIPGCVANCCVPIVTTLVASCADMSSTLTLTTGPADCSAVAADDTCCSVVIWPVSASACRTCGAGVMSCRT